MENTFVKGIVAGALIGGIAALMMAPKTGKESRHMLASGAGQPVTRQARPGAICGIAGERIATTSK